MTAIDCKHSWKTCQGVTYCTDCDAQSQAAEIERLRSELSRSQSAIAITRMEADFEEFYKNANAQACQQIVETGKLRAELEACRKHIDHLERINCYGCGESYSYSDARKQGNLPTWERARKLEAELKETTLQLESSESQFKLSRLDLQSSRDQVERYRKVLTEWRDEFADCTCDDPEKGHESVICHAYFAFDEALSPDGRPSEMLKQEPVPPEFEKIFQENFKDLLADDKPKESDQ